MLGHSSSTPQLVSFTLCYSEIPTGSPPIPLFTTTYPDATVAASPNKTALPASASMVFPTAGSYRFGFCVRNLSPNVNLVENNYANVWFMVTN